MIPTAGAGRRSRRWLPRASTPAKEAQEAVRAGGGASYESWPGEEGVSEPRDRREGTGGSHKSALRRGGSGREPLRRRRA